jgi:hypothetical protein
LQFGKLYFSLGLVGVGEFKLLLQLGNGAGGFNFIFCQCDRPVLFLVELPA